MKPIKPKPMPKALEKFLIEAVEVNAGCGNIDAKDARAILAALAYERKRADDAQARAHVADHLAAASKPGDADDHVRHVEAMRIHLGDARPSDFARVRAEVVAPECQREFTEAVVPKARKPHSECAYMGCETHDSGAKPKRKKKG